MVIYFFFQPEVQFSQNCKLCPAFLPGTLFETNYVKELQFLSKQEKKVRLDIYDTQYKEEADDS